MRSGLFYLAIIFASANVINVAKAQDSEIYVEQEILETELQDLIDKKKRLQLELAEADSDIRLTKSISDGLDEFSDDILETPVLGNTLSLEPINKE